MPEIKKKIPKYEFYPTVKQAEYILCPKQFILYSGSVACGKSLALAYKIYLRTVNYPNAVEVLARKYYTTLKHSTLKSLLSILPENTYYHNKMVHTIDLKGGGQILYLGIGAGEDVKTKIGSINCSGIHMDEAIEFDETDFAFLSSRARISHPLGNQICMVTNPSTQGHWIYRMFFENGTEDKKLIQTTTEDNKEHLPDSFFKQLAQMSESSHRRLVLGQWGSIEGSIFDKFNHKDHVREFTVLKNNNLLTVEGKKVKKFFATYDVGYTHDSVFLISAITEDDVLYVMQENIFQQKTQNTEVSNIKAIIDNFKSSGYIIEKIIVDSAAPGHCKALQELGLPATGTLAETGNQKRVNHSIDLLKNRFEKNKIVIHPICKLLIKQIEAYSWDKDKEKPKKVFDDTVDALRYAAQFISSNQPVLFYNF